MHVICRGKPVWEVLVCVLPFTHSNVALPESSLTEYHAYEVYKVPEIARTQRAVWRFLSVSAATDTTVQRGLLPHRPGQGWFSRGAGLKGYLR